MDTLTKNIEDATVNIIGSCAEKVEEAISGLGAVESVASTNSVVATANATTTQTIPDPTDGSTDDFYSCSYEVGAQGDNISRLVHLHTGQWSTQHGVTTCLRWLATPGCFYTANTQPAYGQTRYFRFIRCGYHFRLLVNAPSGAAGGLMMVWMPYPYCRVLTGSYNVDASVDRRSLLNLPYAILDLRTNTEIDLVIPYVNFRNYVEINATDSVGGAICVFVLGAFTHGSGTSNTVDYTLFGEMLETDLQCPRPFNDQGKKKPRRRPIHKPKSPPQESRIIIQPVPGAANLSNSSVVTMAESVALANEGTAVDYSTAGCASSVDDVVMVLRRWQIVGDFQWANTVTPGNRISRYQVVFNRMPTFALFFDKFQYWRGSLEVKLLTFGSQFNTGRYQMSWYPVSNGEQTLAQCQNSVFVTCDVCATPATLILPFTNTTWRKSTRENFGYITWHVVNRLTVNSTSPSTISCVILMRVGKDFQFTAPLYGGLQMAANNQGDSNQLGDDEPVCFLNFETANVPIQGESHTLVKHLFGRQWLVRTVQHTGEVQELDLPVPDQGHASLLRFFAYFSGEVILTIVNNGTTPCMVAHSYTMDNLTSEYAVTAMGGILIPANSAKNINIPFYSVTPLRPTRPMPASQGGGLTFGRLYIWTQSGSVSVFMGLHKPALFFPLPAPTYTTHTLLNKIETMNLHNQSDQPDCHLCEICRKMKKWSRNHRPFRFCLRLKTLAFELHLEIESDQSRNTRDLTTEGVEPNPGPIMVVGKSGSGKSVLCNILADVNLFESKLTPYSLTTTHQIETVTICGKQVTLIDTPEIPKYDGPISCFLYLIEAGRFTNEDVIFMKTMRQYFPGFEKSTILVLNRADELLNNDQLKDWIKTNGELESLVRACDGRVAKFYRGKIATGKLLDKIAELPEYRAHLPRLVYKDRKMYRHYGVQCGNVVFHMDSENIMKSALNGEVTVKQEKWNGNWKPASEHMQSTASIYLKSDTMPKFKFSVDDNCETWARQLLGDYGPTQGTILKERLMWAVALGFFMTMKITTDQSFPGKDAIHTVLTKISNFIFGGLENEVVRIVIRTVIRIVCYLILYIHSPNIVTTGTLVALLALDATSMSMDQGLKTLCMSLVDGGFGKFCSVLLQKIQSVDGADLKNTIPSFTDMMGDQSGKPTGPKTFNDWTTCAKNVQWWLESFVKVVNWLKEKVFPSKTDPTLQWLEDHEEHISIMLALCDEHLCMLRTDKDYICEHTTRPKHQKLVEMVSGTLNQLNGISSAKDLCLRLQHVLNKLHQVNFEPELEWTHRPEPLGIWISGGPGVGKSFLSNYIVKQIAKKRHWKSYANPTGSKHMDGYVSQEIHVFDDFGQNREEEDYSLICNLISSVPFITPKASVEAKGTQYRGRLVVVTTNRRDFTSCKLTDPDALERRFPIRLNIRPLQKYNHKGRLDVATAMRDGSLQNGTCWERDIGGLGLEHWNPINGDILVDEILSELQVRQEVASFMNQGKVRRLSDLDTMFEELDELKLDFDFDRLEEQARLFARPKEGKISKFRTWVKECINKIKGFLECNRAWILGIGTLGTIVSLITMCIPLARKFTQSIYSAQPMAKTLPKDFKVAVQKHVEKLESVLQDQGGRVNFRHICNRLVNVSSENEVATGLAVGGKYVLTFGHSKFTQLDSIRDMVFNSPAKGTPITYDGLPTDLQLLDCDIPHQFKDVSKLIATDDYRGNGWLVWKDDDQYMIQEVTKIRPFGQTTTASGTTSCQTYIYNCKTGPGSCGGVLVALVGGNLKILGIHTSGNGTMGASNRIFPVFNQGAIVEKKYSGKILYHQPRKTAYQKSPVYEDSPYEPAVLSINDQRLAVPIEDMAKKASDKYIGNTFDPPPPAFQLAKTHVAEKLAKVLGSHDCVSYEQAISSDVIPMNWDTSPGIKYKGETKRQLVCKSSFKQDVMDQIQSPSTVFVCYLKDELRKKEKIKEGKTRGIEACNFDYTVAFRMVMGEIYSNIYDDSFILSGCAVGINPFAEWDNLLANLQPYNLCLDFSGFDGSLSAQILEEAVDVLSFFHNDPALVKKIHEPTIYSTHYVTDEIWKVEGGMCSGSPCTTVLNSIVNQLACYTVLAVLGYDINQCYVVSYGDDCVLSVPEKRDISKLSHYFKLFFGMSATASDKASDIAWRGPMEIEFLKRTPAFLPDTRKIVGVLDKEVLEGKIQWCKGPEAFKQQLDSFFLEAALHGPEYYNYICSKLKARCPVLEIQPWGVARMRAYTACMII
uniref:Genome polyprotein n=1 Tax=Duck hepatitis A virus type 1 TaxID=1006061 RepID=G4XMT8_DHVA1|nr:polyprotein [Duck hepatitis A virus 1]